MRKAARELMDLLVEKYDWKYSCQGCEYEGEEYTPDKHEPDDITTPEGTRSFSIISLIAPQGPMHLVWKVLWEKGLWNQFIGCYERLNKRTSTPTEKYVFLNDLKGQIEAARDVLKEAVE